MKLHGRTLIVGLAFAALGGPLGVYCHHLMTDFKKARDEASKVHDLTVACPETNMTTLTQVFSKRTFHGVLHYDLKIPGYAVTVIEPGANKSTPIPNSCRIL
jgi:hypothetical protein